MSKYPKTSVIDIAMGILENMDPKTSSLPLSEGSVAKKPFKDPNVSDFVPDVSHTDVTDDYISQIIEGSMGIPSPKNKQRSMAPKGNQIPIKETKKHSVNEDEVKDLINRLSSLLSEAKQMIAEMTTVGMIGTNLQGKSKKLKFKK